MDRPAWWDWPKNFRGEYELVWRPDPETGEMRQVKVLLSYRCECGQDSRYGEENIETGEWSWFCSVCWIRNSELFYELQRQIKIEIDKECISILNQSAGRTS